jgi:hypothetical protein
VDLGMAYEVSKSGQVKKTRVLPLHGFQHALQPPQSQADLDRPVKPVLPKQ